MTSKFIFLQNSYKELFAISELSEQLYFIDASSSLAKSRLLSEKISILIWEFEGLREFEGNQLERINNLFNRNFIPEVIKDIFHTIRKSGNKAAHVGDSSETEALFILKKSYQLARWFYETYENDFLESDSYQLPENPATNDIEILKAEVERLSKEVTDYKDKISSLNFNKDEINLRKKRSVKAAKNIHLDETETRKMIIDRQLQDAGWDCDTEQLNYKMNRTMPEKGKNRAIAEWPCDGKWADYALFVGTELYGFVEAKRFATDISTDLHQSKIYAEKVKSLEGMTLLGNWNNHKVPFLFSTNGRSYLEQIKTKSGIWFLDVRNSNNRSHALRGWFSPEGLVDLYKRKDEEANDKLKTSDYDYLENKSGLGLRYYQIDAIKEVEKKIINTPDDNRALLVMATGTGKTRTVIGLVYRLIKANRFKRILFLTDRRLLATQALGNFKDNKIEEINTFSNVYKMEELTSSIPDVDTRLHFATVQSMVKRLFYSDNVLPIDAYDCIIIDEAHRGYTLDKEMDEGDWQFRDENDYIGQYKRVIEYFNAYIIGLTATPALHTTQIFGKPVHNYSYREAVIDGYLVDHEPPFIIKTEFSENGILWQKGERPKFFNAETNTIEELSALEDELLIEIDQFNKAVITKSFNRTVIKELVKHLDPEDDKKTLIFAVRDSHADLIVQYLFEEFEELGIEVPQDAIQKITGNVYEVENLTKRFKNEKFPNIVVTVDLLTTGIDVPQITNLVFMRRVRSRILFEQMLGRATRLCPAIDKQYFKIFDAVRVYEALQDYTQMQTVSNPSISFEKLAEEMDFIDSPERVKKQIQQIIAKLQRKKSKFNDDQLAQFAYLSKKESPEDFIDMLKTIGHEDVKKVIANYAGLWRFLDEKIYQPGGQLVAEGTDTLIAVERGYGKSKKPEDYIESFKNFIQNNRNKIAAIQTICNKPSELDRKSLKELKLLLEQEGYNQQTLNTAWKNVKNVDIAADIISYIRTFTLDKDLVSHNDRIKNAFDKLRAKQDWTQSQLKWLGRFEKQLLLEDIFDKEYMDQTFRNEGGLKGIQKIFKNELDEVINLINEYLYIA